MAKARGSFETDFLHSYLQFGLASMPKADVDALVMSLLDRYGYGGSGPLAPLSNQTVSETLHTPVSKVKKLRYDAALKYGGNVEDQAKGRLLAALYTATLDLKDDKICLVIEDLLAKNWLQGQLKIHKQIYDYSFNTEIVKVEPNGLFAALSTMYDAQSLQVFMDEYRQLKKHKDRDKIVDKFSKLVESFVNGASAAAGAGVVAIVKAHLPIP